MGYGLIIAGLAFLFVPSLGVYDFMPDVIGYALITFGLSKTAQLNGDLQSSRRNFRYLAYLTAVKLVLLFPLVGLRDEMTSMLYVFAFAIAETVFLLPALSELCEGSCYLSSRAGCAVPEKDHNDFKLMSRVFAIARAVLVAVPELTVLTNNAYKESLTAEELDKPTLYDGKNVITLGCAAVSLLIGVVFFVLAVKYFGGLMKDGESVSAIRRRYEEEVDSSELKRAYVAVKGASSLFVCACVFLIPMYFYGLDVLPDLAAAVLMLLAFVKLRRASDTRRAVPAAVFASVYTAALFAAEIYTAQKYFNGSYETSAGTAAAYTATASAKALGFMIFAALIFLLYRSLSEAAAKYTKAPTFDEEGYKKKIERKCKSVGVLGITACALAAAAAFASLYRGGFRFVGAGVFAAYAVYAYTALSKICDEISRRV